MHQRRLSSGPPERSFRPGRADGFRRDDEGQLLILTGVLLVMGFVVVGSTLVQIQTLEESTSRVERDSVLDVFDEVVAKFDQTLLSGAQKSDTNVDGFKERSENAAARMRDSAIGRGMYLTATLDPAPANGFFWSDDRCGAWSSKDDGIIVGYERVTRAETIVGAVYDLYATNGDQSIRAKYYVKLYDCMLTTTTSYVDSYTKNVAESVSGFDGAKAENDNAQASFVEKLVVGAMSQMSETIVQSTISDQGWEDHGSIQTSDADAADRIYDGASTVDHLRFYMDTSTDTNRAWENVVIYIDGWRANGLWIDDLMTIKATYNGDTVGPFTVPATTVDQGPGSYPSVIIPTNPEGGSIWTYTMMKNTVWEISIDEGVSRDLNVDWFVDSVSFTADRGTAWHELDVEFEFDTIPPIFDTHDVEIRYRVSGWSDNFTFQVWDGTQWNTRAVLTAWPDLATWTSATSSGTLPYRLTAAEFNSGTPRFRLIDIDRSDGLLTEQTTLDIDYLRIVSEFIP